MEFTEALEPTDFLDPRCPFCADAYGKERPVHPIDTDRVTAKLDEYLSKNDYAAAERHLAYWLAEAEEGMPRKILLSHNFRSDPGVLDAVNAVFTACMSKDVGELDYGEAEMLRPGKPRPQLPGPAEQQTHRCSA